MVASATSKSTGGVTYQQVIALAKQGKLTQAQFDYWIQHDTPITQAQADALFGILNRTQRNDSWVQAAQQGFTIDPLNPKSSTSAGIQAGAGVVGGWLGSIGGMIASGIEGGIVQLLKDIWNVIVGPLEIVAGIIIAIVVIAIYFKDQAGQVASVAMMLA